MRYSLTGRHWHRSWQVNQWKPWLVLVAVAVVFGHLLVSQTDVLSAAGSGGGEEAKARWTAMPVRAKQGDRGLKMVIATSTGAFTSTPQADAAESTEGQTDTLASPVDAAGRARAGGKGEASDDDDRTDYDDSASSTSRRPVFDALDHLETRYRTRNERLRRACQLRNVIAEPLVFAVHKNETKKEFARQGIHLPESLTVEAPITSHFSMATSLQTMGCFLNKVASSSLVSAFLQTYGLGPSFKSPHSLAFKLAPRSAEDFELANRTYFKFMFVRHPMDRMLSCYMDKMVESTHNSLPPFRSYVKSRARAIMSERLGDAKPSGKTARRTTTAAVQQSNRNRADVLLRRRKRSTTGWDGTEDETRRFIGRKLKTNADAPPNDGTQPSVSRSAFEKVTPANATSAKIGDVPTFEEFLEFVLDSDLQGFGYDAHWVPFHRYCSPCSVPYHVIGKLETGAEDFQYIWRTTGLDTVSDIPWYNKAIGPSKKKIALEKKYYSALPRELILRFYSKFRMDFELFDYSINEILAKAGYDPIEEDNAL